ncbi:MAG: hypothetical protein V8S58_15850 [Lachnospiraceae bacterium]
MEQQQETWKLPEAFVARMKAMLGDACDIFLASYEKERALGLRVNTMKVPAAEFAGQNQALFSLRPVSWCRDGFYYDRESRPGRHPYHEAGVYYIQEPSAMAVVALLAPKPGERVLDLCAAPGARQHTSRHAWKDADFWSAMKSIRRGQKSFPRMWSVWALATLS